MPASQPPIAAFFRGIGASVHIILSSMLALLSLAGALHADVDINECRQKLIAGDHQGSILISRAAIAQRKYGEDWPVLKASAEMATGEYDRALATVAAGIKRYSWSIRLREIGREACLHTGDAKRAALMLKEVDSLASRYPWRYTDVEELVSLGRSALLLGADARDVLEVFFDRAKKYNPKHREPYLASGQLALSKNDHALAGDIFGEAAKHFPEDPDVLYGLAAAFERSDTRRSMAAIEAALQQNPNHVPSLLLMVGHLIDSEQYDVALKWIDRVLKVNPRQPDAWAYRSLLAHLSNDPKGEAAFRGAALSTWRQNPRVDHLIGRKLSQKYRFAEGADYQRHALKFDEKYLPARIQLAQDLLRLGQEDEGWTLADAVHAVDGYDVATFNLVELHDKISKFRTIENDDFIVRMDAHEAEVYGQQVLELLTRAKAVLCKKYGLELTDKVTVEIFPNPDDFGVRTFGMPAIPGFLGVCFGRVITANSPASQGGHPSNWQSVLWHEFCHVVTLQLTHNRIPRWLSEGISVYEELQANPTWGQQMNPRYRKMVLDGELTPVGSLSSAFMSPPSGLHLQFAYYESALAVEFLVQQYGLDSLKSILHDLAAGLPINVALERRTDGIAKLEKDFEQFVRDRAEKMAPDADFDPHDLKEVLSDDSDVFRLWLKKHPNNFAGLTVEATRLMEEKKWQQAQAPLKNLIKLYPGQKDAGNAYLMLSRVYRELNETDNEREILEKYATIDSDAIAVYLRLLELGQQSKNWAAVLKNGDRTLAVNPLIPQPHRALAQAAEKVGKIDTAVTSYRTLLALEPEDPAEVHFRLARLLHQRKDTAAKRHVLAALEEAPRFRAAHKLLLEIVRQQK